VARIAIFIDGAYLDFTLRQEFGEARILYDKFSERLADGNDILRTYYYNCLPYQSNPPTHEERERFSKAQSFMRALERLPRYEVRLGQLAFRGRNERGEPIFVQKRVDIMLGVDLAILAGTHQITHAAIVTGDSDFLPAVKAAKAQGVVVSLWHGRVNAPHDELWQECDERFVLKQDFVESIRRPGRA
jgi:uncharacterized LabA/DUF88 family protein